MKQLLFFLVFLSFFAVSAQNSLSDSDMDSLDQLISDIIETSKKEQKKEKPAAKPKETPKKQKQEAVPAKTKGKKLIVIDPGHGGKDPGAVSGKLREKDVVFKLARKIEKLAANYSNIEVRLTRSKDIFLPLEKRAVIANKMNGDLFISLHANSYKDKNTGGMEIYHLDNTRDEYANKLAKVENRISENTTPLDTILVDMDISYYVGDSLDYAKEIGTGIKNDLKKYGTKLRSYNKGALFYVLVGARMPSLLFEIGYLTNKEDRELLQKDEYLEAIAKSLLDSLSKSKVQ